LSYHHLPLLRGIRSFARKTGILGVIKRHANSSSLAYEEKFATAMLQAVRTNDVVWDIGANVGFYTKQFVQKVGSNGIVVAFEPFPETFSQLSAELSRFPIERCQLCPVAISNENGTASFETESDVNGNIVSTTAHLIETVSSREHCNAVFAQVRVLTADEAQKEFQLPTPVVTKIDVEGFEDEVLQGGEGVFSSEISKHIFVEVHFSRLDARGKSNAPQSIVKRLRGWGYRVKWLDPSHLHAFR
jgi:FkbM family methyltransferase